MSIFISHSFDNKPEFQNVVDALELRGVPFWNPSEVRAGASLREQLRTAVDRCAACIFVATRSSIESAWCGAELGAFWGAGKPIVVYVAEASLPDSALPPIVQGDVYERRIATIAERAKELIGQSARSPTPATAGERSLSQLTVEQFERLLTGALALAAAGAKEDRAPATYQAVAVAAKNVAGSVLTGFQSAGTVALSAREDWHNKILWVDDRPANNAFERESMQAMGLEFTLALSTDEALDILSSQHFAVIISDMGRKEGPQEGYVLLRAVRERGLQMPFFIYAGSRAPEHQREAIARGAQGSTNRARELIDLVAQALPSQ